MTLCRICLLLLRPGPAFCVIVISIVDSQAAGILEAKGAATTESLRDVVQVV